MRSLAALSRLTAQNAYDNISVVLRLRIACLSVFRSIVGPTWVNLGRLSRVPGWITDNNIWSTYQWEFRKCQRSDEAMCSHFALVFSHADVVCSCRMCNRYRRLVDRATTLLEYFCFAICTMYTTLHVSAFEPLYSVVYGIVYSEYAWRLLLADTVDNVQFGFEHPKLNDIL